jgi:hypothetical protein
LLVLVVLCCFFSSPLSCFPFSVRLETPFCKLSLCSSSGASCSFCLRFLRPFFSDSEVDILRYVHVASSLRILLTLVHESWQVPTYMYTAVPVI